MADINRRRFLQGGGMALAASLSVSTLAPPAAAEMAAERIGRGGKYQLQVFSPQQMTLVEAAVDQFIPADELSPAASELGVAEFIDSQLARSYGQASCWYMQGPFDEGLPTQGYQSRRTPEQLIKAGVDALESHVGESYQGQRFAKLDATTQQTLLKAVESGELELNGVDGQLFFSQLLALTKQGFFADPMHGGNRGMASWKMIGFPGARASFYDWASKTDKPYKLPPVAIKEVSE